MTNKNSLEDWTIEQPLDFEVSQTYIARAYHVRGYWADFLITITEKTPEGHFGFNLDTILNGTPGIVKGYLRGRAEVADL